MRRQASLKQAAGAQVKPALVGLRDGCCLQHNSRPYCLFFCLFCSNFHVRNFHKNLQQCLNRLFRSSSCQGHNSRIFKPGLANRTRRVSRLIMLCPVVLRLVRRSFQPALGFAEPRLFLDRGEASPVFYPSFWLLEYNLLCVLKSSGAQNGRWPRRHERSILQQRM